VENFQIHFFDEYDHLMSGCVVFAADEVSAIRDAAIETKTRLSVVGRIQIERLNPSPVCSNGHSESHHPGNPCTPRCTGYWTKTGEPLAIISDEYTNLSNSDADFRDRD
jgi:hypothetical protein